MSEWIRPPSGHITEHFTWAEAACHHCGLIPSVEVVRATAEWAEKVRAFFNEPMHINSWCRCETYNATLEKHGASKTSYHIKGMAIDFTIKTRSPRQVQAFLKRLWGPRKLIRGLGKYLGFTHIDRREGNPSTWNG